MQSRIGCTCLTFLHCAFSNDPSNSVPEKRYSRIGCICLNFLHCAFYMLPQMIFIRGRIVAYVAGGGVIPIPKTFLKLPMQWACWAKTTFTFYFSILNIVKLAWHIVAKGVTISTNQFFPPKNSTKKTRFTTFSNSRQNSVNVLNRVLVPSSTGASSTSVSSAGAHWSF